MSDPTNDWARVADALEAMRGELARLTRRVEALEAAAPAAPAAPQDAAPRVSEGITEEQVVAIAAAIAAWLGVKPRIRQIRVLPAPGWAQQGRMTIQASHRLTRSER